MSNLVAIDKSYFCLKFQDTMCFELIMFLGDKSRIYCWNAIPMATCNYIIN